MMCLKQLLIACAVFLLVALASQKATSFEAKSYVGFDYQLNKMNFDEKYGNNLFHRNHLSANFYSVVKVNDSLSAEIGYFSTIPKTKDAILYTNDFLYGKKLIGLLSPVIFKTRIKIKGHHFSFVSICSPKEWESSRILGGVGLAFLTANAESNTVSYGQSPRLKGTVRHFKKQKAVLRLMVAHEYRFKNRLGIRSSVCFIQTSKMRIVARPISPNMIDPMIKLRDSYVYGLGMFFDF